MKLVAPPSDFRYTIFSATNPPDRFIGLHDSAYELWLDVWTGVYSGLGLDTSVLKAEFGRQDMIATIFCGDEPVAVHLYSFFSTKSRASLDQSYMAQYPKEFYSGLEAAGLRSVMSLEYMTVNPAWRKGRFPVHMGSVLVGLSCEVMKYFGHEASIAPARRDHKVHEIAYAFGGEPVLANVISHNVPCDLLAIRADRCHEHADSAIRAMIADLWKHRIEATGLIPAADLIALPFAEPFAKTV